MIAAATIVVADIVALLAITYGMISVVARALGREADTDGRFIHPSAILTRRANEIDEYIYVNVADHSIARARARVYYSPYSRTP